MANTIQKAFPNCPVLFLYAALIMVIACPVALCDSSISASRTISDQYVNPGEQIQVTVHITVNEDLTALSLGEDVPSGWIVERVDDDANLFDPQTNEWLWMANLPAGTMKTVTYSVEPAGNPGTFLISGSVSAYQISSIGVNGDETVNVDYAPTAGFTGNPISGFKPLSVSFIDYSLNTTVWDWDFGDGYLSDEEDPVHVYDSSGTFTVTLNASSYYGYDMESKENYITVYSVDFSANTTAGFDTLAVRFTDLSYGVDYWQWDFGDGNTSSEQHPVHVYDSPGSYNVSLTAGNFQGSAVETKSGFIDVYSVDFTSNVSSGFDPFAVQFTDLSGGADFWQWDFGDGDTSSEQHPVHVYDSPGSYNVSLIAGNSQGSAVETKTGYITAYSVDFTANTSYGPNPLAVAFTDMSFGATGWEWDVDGDGFVDYTVKNPQHAYALPGSYTVSLTVNSGEGTHTETKENFVVVWDNDWNPWNDPDSDEGEYISLGEIQLAIYYWQYYLPLPETGHLISLSEMQSLVFYWQYYMPM